MSNHQVSLSSDTNTAVITFDADGLINFEDGDQNVSYATRASQTWIKHDGEWKVMHSHWSPRTNSQGIKELDMRKTGGFVPIGVKEKADDVPAMLSKNEFVMTADAVRAAGGGSINKGAQRMYDTMKKLESRVA